MKKSFRYKGHFISVEPALPSGALIQITKGNSVYRMECMPRNGSVDWQNFAKEFCDLILK